MMKKAVMNQCNDYEVRYAKAILSGVYDDELLIQFLRHNNVQDNPPACSLKSFKWTSIAQSVHEEDWSG